MRNVLRRASLLRILLTCALAVVVGAAAAVVASAGSDPTPPPTSLANAVHGAVTAPRTAGLSADVTVTEALLPGDTVSGQSTSPLLSGGSGRLWIDRSGRVRLEIQSDQGDAEIYLKDDALSYFDDGTLYRVALGAPRHVDRVTSPSTAQIQRAIDRLRRQAVLTGPAPGDVAGHAAYEVQVSPRSHGGLVGGLRLWWDARHGAPLRFAIYATGNPQPVLDVTATSVSYGAVDPSVFDIPPAAHTIDAALPHGSGNHASATQSDLASLRAALPFGLAAPAELAGRTLNDARLLHADGHPAALLTYGDGLDGLAVVETAGDGHGGGGGSQLPSFRIGDITAAELPTALGTLVHFQRDGVAYTLLGSVDRATAQLAAAGR